MNAIIFDLDGTLLNTLEDLHDALNYTLSFHSLPLRTLEETRRFVGNGIPKLVERAAPPGTDTAPLLDTFLPRYRAHSMDKTRPYPGVCQVLEALKEAGKPTAIVTNKAQSAALPLCAHFFPQADFVIGEQSGLARKPAGDMVWAALDALGVSREEAVYVGDSEVDAATARNAGLPFLAVTWGFRDREMLEEEHPWAMAHTPEDLLQHLL